MKIQFYTLAVTEDTEPVWTAEMDIVPRVGENVVLPVTMAVNKVCDVTYVVSENLAIVILET